MNAGLLQFPCLRNEPAEPGPQCFREAGAPSSARLGSEGSTGVLSLRGSWSTAQRDHPPPVPTEPRSLTRGPRRRAPDRGPQQSRGCGRGRGQLETDGDIQEHRQMGADGEPVLSPKPQADLPPSYTDPNGPGANSRLGVASYSCPGWGSTEMGRSPSPGGMARRMNSRIQRLGAWPSLEGCGSQAPGASLGSTWSTTGISSPVGIEETFSVTRWLSAGTGEPAGILEASVGSHAGRSGCGLCRTQAPRLPLELPEQPGVRSRW